MAEDDDNAANINNAKLLIKLDSSLAKGTQHATSMMSNKVSHVNYFIFYGGINILRSAFNLQPVQ